MPQPIFYFDKLNLWDRISLPFYILLSIVLLYYFIHLEDYNSKKDALLCYSLGTQLMLYFINYKSLRNLTVYFIWILFAIAHLYFYFQLKDNHDLFYVRGQSSATGLRNTIFLLLLFQVLRFISVKAQGQELVCPSKGGNTDLFDGRKATYIDIILFFVYFGCTVWFYSIG
jgi:hypothetical protein